MEYRLSVSFSMPARYLEGIRQLSRVREESMSFIVRDALRDYLEANLPGWSAQVQTSRKEEHKG